MSAVIQVLARLSAVAVVVTDNCSCAMGSLRINTYIKLHLTRAECALTKSGT
jgi:hypothetical protein